MKPADDYNYETAGFDSFLSRSIDGLPQANLDTLGPVSREVGYDRSQFSGYTSDTIRIGQTKVDASGVKVANQGQDVTSARDDQLAFDSARNTFYIVKSFKASWTITLDSTSLQAGLSVAHSLNFVPDKIEGKLTTSWAGGGRSYNLPAHFFGGGISYFGKFGSATIAVDGFDNNFLYLTVIAQDIAGFAWAATNPTINFTLYCLKATQAPIAN